MPAAKRLRNWLFVINNYTDTDVDQLMLVPVKYMIIGFEIGEKTYTPHIQGYLQFHEGRTLKAVSEWIPRASIMEPNGTPQQNRTYCMKPETKEDPSDWFEFGEVGPGSGYRSDLEEIREMLLDNSLEYVADNRFSQWSQYGRSFNIYKEMKFKPIQDRQVISYENEDDVLDLASTNIYYYNEFDQWADYNDQSCILVSVMTLSLPGQINFWYRTGTFMVKGKHLKCHTFFINQDDINRFSRYRLQIKSLEDIENEIREENVPEEIPEESISEASGYESF